MDIFKKNVIIVAICGVAIFSLGMFVGYELDNDTIASIQGYLYNAAATDPNASDSNASDSNASDSNASDSNASDANASDSNASISDNIIYLQNFALGSTSVKQGDRVNVTIRTSGACNSAATIVFKSANGNTITAQVQDIAGNPYIVIPNASVATTYSVSDVLLVGKNSDNTTFTKQYSTTGTNRYSFNSNLTVVAKDNGTQNVNKVTLSNISISSSTVAVGDKVYLTVQASEKLTDLKLTFNTADGNAMIVYGKSLDSKPYFEVPSSTIAGTYSLTSVVISTSNSSTAYSKDGGNDTEKYDFNSSIEITQNNGSKLVYNNENVDSDVINKLYNAPNGTEITINADSNTLINQELFNAIKGKNKKLVINYKDNQIVFNGNDIDSSKTIDVSMTVNDVTNNTNINKLVSKGIVVNFPDNGNLPGKALIRVKATEEINSVLNEKVYVYVFNESSNDFCVVDTSVKKSSDNYYEFSISHNSDYLIVNEQLDSKLVVVKKKGDIVSFQKGNKTLLMLIAIGVVVVIAAVIVIVVIKKKKSTVTLDVNDLNAPVNNEVVNNTSVVNEVPTAPVVDLKYNFINPDDNNNNNINNNLQ